jgi:hypothetical protein
MGDNVCIKKYGGRAAKSRGKGGCRASLGGGVYAKVRSDAGEGAFVDKFKSTEFNGEKEPIGRKRALLEDGEVGSPEG